MYIVLLLASPKQVFVGDLTWIKATKLHIPTLKTGLTTPSGKKAPYTETAIETITKNMCCSVNIIYVVSLFVILSALFTCSTEGYAN